MECDELVFIESRQHTTVLTHLFIGIKPNSSAEQKSVAPHFPFIHSRMVQGEAAGVVPNVALLCE